MPTETALQDHLTDLIAAINFTSGFISNVHSALNSILLTARYAKNYDSATETADDVMVKQQWFDLGGCGQVRCPPGSDTVLPLRQEWDNDWRRLFLSPINAFPLRIGIISEGKTRNAQDWNCLQYWCSLEFILCLGPNYEVSPNHSSQNERSLRHGPNCSPALKALYSLQVGRSHMIMTSLSLSKWTIKKSNPLAYSSRTPRQSQESFFGVRSMTVSTSCCGTNSFVVSFTWK